MTRRSTNDRLAGLAAAFLFVIGALWVRCAWLQVLGSSKLSTLAQAQHRISRPVIPQRGMIYDRHGRVLAMSARVPSVFANPRHVAAKQQTAQRLSKAIGKDARFIAKRLNKDKGFVWLARKVDPQAGAELALLRRDGIATLEEPERLYPQGSLASHVLGFVDIDQRGLEGMELAYHGALRGRAGWQSTLRDAKGDLLIGPWTVEAPAEPGLDLVLTIDSVVQEAAEDALAWGVDKFHAKGGSVIVLDPYTGEILAMATEPNFDPNRPGKVPIASRRNRAITDLSEPGSVFKIVTAAALLEENLAQPTERVFCENGNYPTIGRHVLHDHKPHGWLTFHEVIQYSSNIGTVKLAQRLKPEQLYRYIRGFGFGSKTGIELPGEINGIVPPPSRWSKLSPFIIPMGQEVATTPIQVVTMLATIANGGWKVQPSIIKEVRRADGAVVRRGRSGNRTRLLRTDTTDVVQEMLLSVVESGTGQLASVPGLLVAGKTGTAQKLEPNGRYSHSLFVASFVGYGPVPDPRFVMIVSIDEPRPLYFGGVVAAPIFQRVVKQLVGYWDLTTPSAQQTLAKLPMGAP